MNPHTLLVIFLLASVFYNGVMAWIWNTHSIRAFLFFKATPAVLSVGSLIYLLNALGYIVAAH